MAIAQNISIFCNGVNLGSWLKSLDPNAEVEELDATVLANNYRSYEAGFKTGMISAEGLFSSDTATADEIHDVFNAAYTAGTSNVVTASFTTPAVGGPAVMLDGPELKYSVNVTTGELVMVQAEFRATNGLSFGYWLANAGVSSGTTNGTTHDNAALTSNGGVFHVHLHNDDASDCDFKVQHSTDGSSWADLTGATVNNLSATRAAGSATVATGTTVNRYTRLVSVLTGGEATLVSAAFARR
jgi:hypothetical protein